LSVKQAARCKRTPFTPTVAVVVNAGNEIWIAGQFREVASSHGWSPFDEDLRCGHSNVGFTLMKIAPRQFRKVLTALERYGVLPLSDSYLPSAVSLLAGESVSGSWWGHPKAHEIFRGINQLGETPDVLSTKLLSGKVTFVHRRLWRDFLSIAAAGESWQTRG